MSSMSTGYLRDAAERLSAARRPAILLGPEGSGAVPLILEIADVLGAPIATTPDALSLIDGHRSCGVFSFGASAHVRRTFQRADLVLAVSALGEFSCRLGEAFARHSLVQVAETATCVGRRREPDLALLGPVAVTLQQLRNLLARNAIGRRRSWSEPLPRREPVSAAASARDTIHPEAAILAIEAALPEQARVCLDVTSAALHAYEHWRLTPDQRAFSSIENSACMGEALMASLGVRLASGLPTLALVGDWGYCMTPAELHTAVELGLDRYVVVVWSNGGGAFIRAGVAQQRIRVPDQAWRWQHPPSFARVAEAYGAQGISVSDALALEHAVTAGLRSGPPLLIEARIAHDAPIPAGDRFSTLGGS